MKFAIRAAVATTSLALLLTGCGNAPDKEPAATEELPTAIPLADDIDTEANFSWAYTQYTSSWDPTKSIGGGDVSFYVPVYDRLLDLNEDATVSPMLAEDFTAEGNTVTLHLRDGLTFSDGTPMDADAVKFNLERAAAPESTLLAEVAQFESATVIDPLTVEVTVSSGLGAYLTALAARAGMMISPDAVKSGAIENEPVGVGPYVVTSQTPGDKVEYEKTPGYWDPDAQHVASRTYYLMADDQTRYNALQSGEIDGAFLNPNQIDTAIAADLQVIAQPSTSFVYFMVNPTIEPFDDPEVRRALNYAVDRQAIADGLYEGYCSPGIQPWPESSPGYSESIGDGSDAFPHDPQQAQEILTEAGYTEPIEIQAVTTNVTQYQNLAEALQDQIKDAGFEMTIEPLPPTQVVEKFVLNQEADGNVNPYTGLGDPHGVLARNYLPGGTYSFGGQFDEATTQKTLEASGPVDPEERRAMYEELMQGMIDTPTHMLSLCQVHLAAAFGPQVSNVEQSFTGATDLRAVAISKE
ncbi:ABC transporter substrate-binding protein [Cumulibacter soli]|uniref:ABC transporter substrate-binding protein n=1 Tax=Cumulibacter soli TaxID=2546344 RepID=UPI00106736C5|nr:ABC transporter substrate-binding protein [Cumulibacter soli]